MLVIRTSVSRWGFLVLAQEALNLVLLYVRKHLCVHANDRRKAAATEAPDGLNRELSVDACACRGRTSFGHHFVQNLLSAAYVTRRSKTYEHMMLAARRQAKAAIERCNLVHLGIPNSQLARNLAEHRFRQVSK
jgi:hypothetical protein